LRVRSSKQIGRERRFRKYSPKAPQFGVDYSFAQQEEVLERSIAIANALGTDRVRFFDFWRLDDPNLFATRWTASFATPPLKRPRRR